MSKISSKPYSLHHQLFQNYALHILSFSKWPVDGSAELDVCQVCSARAQRALRAFVTSRETNYTQSSEAVSLDTLMYHQNIFLSLMGLVYSLAL